MANYNSSYTGAQIDSAVGRANSTDVTAGTVAASKAVVVDSNKDVTGFRNITGTGTATFANFIGTGDIDIGDASGDTVTITASVDSNIVPSADDTYDLGGSSAQWKDLYVDGTAYIDAIDFNGTAITSTGAELNLIDGGTARGTTAVATGDGILINDAGTMRMTNVDTVSTYFASHNVGGGNIVTTGALDSGSITSGFGNIDIGSSTFDTTGAVATGALTVGGNIDFNSGTIDLSTQTVDVTLNAAVDALNFDSNTLSIDASNNRVGIGTASPSVPLDVVGTLKVGAASGGRYFNLINDSANSYLDVSHGLVVRTNGASSLVSSMFISTAGNVGIGTAAPLAKFEIQKAGVDTNAETDAFLNLHDSSVYNWGLRLDTGSTLHFDTEYSSTDVTRVTFQRDGNVGIGTAAPGEKLEVAGTIWINPSGQADLYVDGHTSSDATVRLMEGGSSEFTIMHDSNVSRFQIRDGNPSGTEVFSIEDGASANSLYINSSGNVGIGTLAPGQLLDVNSGGGNMIADGYDTHSLAVYKENIEDASGYLDKVLACPAQKWNRKPFVSADEIKEAVLEEFGEDVLIEEAVEAQDAVYETVVVQEAVEEVLWSEDDDLPEDVEIGDVKTEAQEEETEEQLVSEAIESKDAVYERQYSVWDELFPEDNSHRQKALYNMPDGDLKTWIDDWCEAKRVEMRPEDKWQKKRLGLVADAELTAEHLPEVVSINDDGEPTGIDTMTYIGILHNAIQELSAKVEALENA